MTEPRFDWLAPHYARIEAATFGGLLHWCRTALLDERIDARRVLVLGEGDGRFLSAFLDSNCDATVDVLDASAAMIALAKRRIAQKNATRVRWHVADVRRGELPDTSYDLIVTNFFLDCFPASDLEPLVRRLADALADGGRWLVGDFGMPEGLAPRLAAHAALTTMYLAFNLTTRIPASRLVNPRPLLHACGLNLEREKRRLAGFLTSSLWRRDVH